MTDHVGYQRERHIEGERLAEGGYGDFDAVLQS